MVQRKVSQKAKSASASSVKPEKKALSNGYGKTKPKAKSTKKPTKTMKPINDTSLSDEPENIETRDSSKQADHYSKDSPENDAQDNISHEDAEEVGSKKAVSSDKGKSRKKANPGPSKASSVEEKSLKRKAVAETEQESKEKADKKSAVTKIKAKKQKIVLEVPSLSSSKSGQVFVVGENDCGQIGLDKDVDLKEKPFLLDLPYPIIDIAAGGMHSVCLTEGGEVITFGCNDEGALGRVASDEEECIPKKVEIPEKIVQISAGDSHSAGLAESGQVYLWGNFRNGEGQMGLTPDGQKRIAPVKVLTDKIIVKIASGGDHLACLSNDGVLFTCGCAEQGQLGRVNLRSCRSGGRQKGLATLLEPGAVKLKPERKIHDVWTESYATFLKVQETGSIYAFGLNNYNQLGLQNVNNDQENQMAFFPLPVPSFNADNKSWKQINGGQHHTLALDSNGLVHALGRKEYGRLGLGEDCEDTSAPTAIPTLEKEKCDSVSCGNTVSYAVTKEGSLYSWGMESSQLGHGSQGNSEDIHAPRLIKGELFNSWKVIKVSGGGQHALILASRKPGSSADKNA